jgi:hypothetical protein
MNAYAQAIDVLAKALAGGGLSGQKRSAAFAQMLKTGMMLSAMTLLYCWAVGDDDDYLALDDQTKLRNIIIPGTKIKLPMHTSASFFFKAIPELLYNKIMNEGTKNQIDNTRLRTAFRKIAVDSLLGPNVTPTGIKPTVEVVLDHDFFTGGTVTPRSKVGLDASRQFTSSTSELGKIMSKMSGGVLNPIQMDHLVHGQLGTIGLAAMWGSNLFSGNRPTGQEKDNPLYGSFMLSDVPRGKEELFYDFQEHSDVAYKTFEDLAKHGHKEEAARWMEDHKDMIKGYGYTSQMANNLKEINGEIRRISDQPPGKMTPDQQRARINELSLLKNKILDEVTAFRLKAGM